MTGGKRQSRTCLVITRPRFVSGSQVCRQKLALPSYTKTSMRAPAGLLSLTDPTSRRSANAASTPAGTPRQAPPGMGKSMPNRRPFLPAGQRNDMLLASNPDFELPGARPGWLGPAVCMRLAETRVLSLTPPTKVFPRSSFLDGIA